MTERYNEMEDRSPIYIPGGGFKVISPSDLPPWMKPDNKWPPYDKGNCCDEDDDKEEKMKVKIKSVIEDEFVIVNDEYLYATGEKSNKNGIFKIIFLGNDKIKIRQVDGGFVRLDNKDRLIADVKKKDAEIFRLYKVDKKEYVLRASNGNYVRVRDDDKILVARAESPCKRCVFKFKEVD